MHIWNLRLLGFILGFPPNKPHIKFCHLWQGLLHFGIYYFSLTRWSYPKSYVMNILNILQYPGQMLDIRTDQNGHNNSSPFLFYLNLYSVQDFRMPGLDKTLQNFLHVPFYDVNSAPSMVMNNFMERVLLLCSKRSELQNIGLLASKGTWSLLLFFSKKQSLWTFESINKQ